MSYNMVGSELPKNVHAGLPAPSQSGTSYFVKGSYVYHHYLCDGTKDQGWGCGYRTLQSLCSWIVANRTKNTVAVPSILEIQEILVKLEDKYPTFVGSKDWIGSFEDPHYIGKTKSASRLQQEGWVKWQVLEDFTGDSFYNICLPQTKPDS